MKYKVLEGGFEPKRAHFDDAGIDFRSPETFTLGPAGSDNDSYVVDFKVSVEIPIGYFGKMESKSGLMVNHGICCCGGVIDSGFRGTIKVRMINHSHEPYTFERGDKVVQMVVQPVLLCTLDKVDELDPSDSGRNDSGWGSTGK